AIATTSPLTLERSVFADWLATAVTPRDGFVTVVLQTLVEEHFTPLERDTLHSMVAAIGGAAIHRAPFAHLRMEQQSRFHETTVRMWPGNTAVTICRSDGHAQDIRWVEDEAR